MDRLLMTSLRRLLLVAATSGNNLGERTIIGNPVSFNTNVAKPLRQMLIPFAPVQDLHGQDSPYPAGGGKNKYSGPSTVVVDNQLFANIEVDPIPAGTYTISATIGFAPATGASCRISFRDSSGSAVEAVSLPYTANTRTSISFTLSETSSRIYFYYDAITSGKGNQTFVDVQIESGTSMTAYAPYSNICPITGWTGVNVYRTGTNIWDEQWEEGEILSTTGQNNSGTGVWRSVNYIPIKPETEYFVWYPGTATPSIRARFYDEEKTYIGYFSYSGNEVLCNRTFKTPKNAYFMRFAPNASYISDHQISINYPSTDTDYHPYSGTTIPVVFPGLGKNLWNGQIINGESEIQGLAVGETYTVSASMINPETSTYLYLRKKVPGGSYTTVSQIIRNMAVTPGTFTVEEGDTYALWANASYTNVGNVQIEKGSSATSFEPFTNTAYSGTLDLTTGELTVDMGIVDLGTLSWSLANQGTANERFKGIGILPVAKVTGSSQVAAHAICSIYPITAYADVLNHTSAKIAAIGNDANIYVYDPSFTDSTSFETAMSGVQLVYELAEPLTYQLTPSEITTLIGDNTIWSDTNGENTIKYLKKG